MNVDKMLGDIVNPVYIIVHLLVYVCIYGPEKVGKKFREQARWDKNSVTNYIKCMSSKALFCSSRGPFLFTIADRIVGNFVASVPNHDGLSKLHHQIVRWIFWGFSLVVGNLKMGQDFQSRKKIHIPSYRRETSFSLTLST